MSFNCLQIFGVFFSIGQKFTYQFIGSWEYPFSNYKGWNFHPLCLYQYFQMAITSFLQKQIKFYSGDFYSIFMLVYPIRSAYDFFHFYKKITNWNVFLTFLLLSGHLKFFTNNFKKETRFFPNKPKSKKWNQ